MWKKLIKFAEMEKIILEGEIGYDVTLKDLQGSNNFLINSYGGDLLAGLAMHDYLKGSDADIGVVGSAMSAATLLLIATKNRWGTSNSRYLIHNPYTFAMGESKNLEKAAQYLKFEQEKIVKMYVEELTIPEDEIRALMDKNDIIDANEALRIGLIKEVKDLNADEQEEIGDITNFNNTDSMSEKSNFGKTIMQKVDKVLDLLKGSEPIAKMLVLQDTNGTELDFGDEIETAEQIAVGATATVEGQPANGEFVMSDGNTMVFENGQLTEIKEVEAEAEESEEMTALKTENDELKTQLGDLQMKLEKVGKEKEDFTEKVSVEMNDLKQEVEKLQNLSTDDSAKMNVPSEEPEKKATTRRGNRK